VVATGTTVGLFQRLLYCVGKYCDIPLGLFLVRGDNLILMGDVDDEKEENQKLVEVTPAELTELLASGGNVQKVEWDFE
jgi:hypothetical protein